MKKFVILTLLLWCGPTTAQTPSKAQAPTVVPVENTKREVPAVITLPLPVVVNGPVAIQPPAHHWLQEADTYVAFGTLLLVVVTGLLASFTYKLWNSTGDLVRDSKQTLIANRRAFVFCQEVSSGSIVWSEPWKICFLLKNGGLTPTQNMTYQVGWQVFDGDMPHNFIYPKDDHKIRDCFIGPNSVALTDFVSIPHNVWEPYFRTPAQQLYVWGFASYNDVFPGTPAHESEFSFKILAERIEGPGAIAFEHTKRHNKAD